MLTSAQYKGFIAISALMLGGFGWLGWRLYDIQIRRHAVLADLAERYTYNERLVEPWRGSLRDRNGFKLALSVPEKTVYLDLNACGTNVNAVAATCGRLLRLPCESVASTIRFARGHLRPGGHSPATTVVLKQHVAIDEWAAVVSAVKLEGFGFDLGKLSGKDKARLYRLRQHLLFATDAQARRYPYGESLAQVLGFCSPLDDGGGLEGKCGLEKTYDAELRGTYGAYVSEQDAAGREVRERRSDDAPAVNGCNLELTIDLPLQRMVEQTLCVAVARAKARGIRGDHGPEIVRDPGNGRVPEFQPAGPGRLVARRLGEPVPRRHRRAGVGG